VLLSLLQEVAGWLLCGGLSLYSVRVPDVYAGCCKAAVALGSVLSCCVDKECVVAGTVTRASLWEAAPTPLCCYVCIVPRCHFSGLAPYLGPLGPSGGLAIYPPDISHVTPEPAAQPEVTLTYPVLNCDTMLLYTTPGKEVGSCRCFVLIIFLVASGSDILCNAPQHCP
jgi:hypothetical protein